MASSSYLRQKALECTAGTICCTSLFTAPRSARITLRLGALALIATAGPAAAQAPDPTVSLPLAPLESFSFRTTEGTWIALDVSPDGRTIVFGMVGNLFLLP